MFFYGFAIMNFNGSRKFDKIDVLFLFVRVHVQKVSFTALTSLCQTYEIFENFYPN